VRAHTHGYGCGEDLGLKEEEGCIAGADASKVSERAVERGYKQIGTLGSGNHYLEIQVTRKEHIFEPELAHAFGITIPDQVVVLFHCGSRRFGHQVATDYLQVFLKVMENKYGIKILGPRTAFRPLQFTGRPELLRCHEMRTEHVICQSPGNSTPHSRSLFLCVRTLG
jgi:tRNA-splicing ligase RtcB (3'-phosphate/5'-hydroxy nucleic acid ligase)